MPSLVSTFPSEYIFDPRALAEARRCLRVRGRLIVLPVAMPKNRFLEWLYKVTGESPADTAEVFQTKIAKPFEQADFIVTTKVIELKSSTLIVILAEKV